MDINKSNTNNELNADNGFIFPAAPMTTITSDDLIYSKEEYHDLCIDCFINGIERVSMKTKSGKMYLIILKKDKDRILQDIYKDTKDERIKNHYKELYSFDDEAFELWIKL